MGGGAALTNAEWRMGNAECQVLRETGIVSPNPKFSLAKAPGTLRE